MLNHYFFDSPIDFEKRCKNRILLGVVFLILGVLTLIAWSVSSGWLPILAPSPEAAERISAVYIPLGAALAAAGLIRIRRNRILLRNPDLRKKEEIRETDERNRIIGLRCWAYAGYAMFLLLYLGILAAGFFSLTVLRVFLGILGVFALLLFIFRLILQRCM